MIRGISGFQDGGHLLPWILKVSEFNQLMVSRRLRCTTVSGVSTVMFRYCLLGGDTAVPSALYTRLFHAFLVKIEFFMAVEIQRANVPQHTKFQ